MPPRGELEDCRFLMPELLQEYVAKTMPTGEWNVNRFLSVLYKIIDLHGKSIGHANRHFANPVQAKNVHGGKMRVKEINTPREVYRL
jgi:hypothetical protein